MKTAPLTIFEAIAPAQIGKLFKRGPDGVRKETCGDLYEARYRVERVGSASDLASLLLALRPNEVLSTSCPANGSTSGHLVTKARQPEHPGSITRCKPDWTFGDGPAWLTLDYDPRPGALPLQPDELREVLRAVLPALSSVPVVHWHSASSWIYDGDAQIKGLGGQRVYVLLQTGGDVVRAGTALNQRLRLAGHGHTAVTASGALVERGLWDAAMWQPGRLDFISGALTRDGIEQRRPAPTVWGEGAPLDSVEHLSELSADEAGRLAGLLAQERERAMPEALAARAAHRAATIQRRLPSMMSTNVSASEAERRIGEAVDAAFGGVLLGDFELTAVRPDGRQEVVTVAQVLSDRDRWHEVDVLDPINPGHRGGSADGRLYLHSASPIVFSLDDGGRVWRLRTQKVRVVASAGARSDVVQQLATVAAELDSVFRSDGGVVQLIDGRPVSLTKTHLLNLLGREVAFFKATGKGEVPADIGPDVAEQVLAELSIRSGLKVLAAVVDLPYPTRSGRVVVRSGYDEETGVYLNLAHEWAPNIPTHPTPEQVRAAVVQMMSPWRGYRFSSADDAAGMVSSVLAALSRASLQLCPASLLDASQQGSGKTKAAMALCALVEGRLPAVTPYSAGGNDDEVRKWLLSCVVGHARSVVLDNVVGHVRSAALAGVLTSGRISGRVLGESRTVDSAVRFLLTVTGNNASLDADMLRRSVRVRIDAGVDPTHKAFDFDPVTEALRQRRRIAEAACVIWSAYAAAGLPDVVKGDAGGFSDWNRLCRQPVLWLAREGLADGLPWKLGDPAGSMLADASYSDPEIEALGALLHGLHEVHGGTPFLAADVLALHKAGGVGSGETAAGRVRAAVDDLLGGGQVSTRKLGLMLKNRRDRPVGGLKLLAGPVDRIGSRFWQVASVPAA